MTDRELLEQVASNVAELRRRVDEMLERYGPLLEMVEKRTAGPRMFRRAKEGATNG